MDDTNDQFDPSDRDDGYHEEPEPDEPSCDQPAEPTSHLPGSSQKIDVLRSRYERGEGLWHDSDITFERHGESILENLGSIFSA